MAYRLLLPFSTKLRWLPGLSSVSGDMTWLGMFRVCALAATALRLVIVARMMRMTRAAILNVLNDPYMEIARFSPPPPLRF